MRVTASALEMPRSLGAHHVDRHLQRGGAGALADPGLEHPELALLDGELGVAHVAVVRLEPGEDLEQLGVDLGELLLQLRDRLGVADAGHHVLALGVDQEVAVGALVAGGRVAGEADAGARVVVAVAEDHGLHVDRGAQVVRDALAVAVGDGPGPVPAAEDRLDGAAQLVGRVLGEGLAGVALDDLLVGVDQVAQQLGGHLGVRGGAGQLLGRVEEGVELLAGELEHDAPVHGDEAAVGVEGEALVTGLGGQPLDRLVVEAEVEDGVHHPGHGELGPRAHRDQQRVLGVADGLAHRLLQAGPGRGHLGVETLGPAAGHVGPAGVGRDGEARRDGQLEYRRHLGQVGALATEEILELHGWAGVRVVEIEDVRHQASLPWAGRTAREHGHEKVVSPPDLGRATSAYFPLRAPLARAGRIQCRRSAARADVGGLRSPQRPSRTWRWKTSLAWRMKSRTRASSSALKCWATWRISSAIGCCRPARRSCGLGHDLDPDPAPVLGVAPARHHAGLLETVENEGHRSGGQPALLGQVARR